jgi:transcriptional regulator with XRE-family HTH domain
VRQIKVNQNLRVIRKSKGMTQKYVAISLGMPVQTYNSYELGRRKISADLLKEIAIVLDEPIENFFENKLYETKNIG